MKLGVSRAHFDIVVGTQAWILRPPYSFLTRLFLQSVVLKKEYRKQNRGMKIVKIMDKVAEN